MNTLSEILISTALTELNATRHSLSYYPTNEDCYQVLMAPCLYPVVKSEWELGFFATVQNQIMITSFPGFSFLSCHMVSSGLNFNLYLAPYDGAVWIVTVFMIFLSGSVLSFGFYALYKENYAFNLFLYIFGCLIDEVIYIPKKLLVAVPFRVLIIPWLLLGMILSNCYLSILITNLNKPQRGERADKYEQISCLSNKQQITTANYTMISDRFYAKELIEGDNIANFTLPPLVKSLGGYCYTILSSFKFDFLPELSKTKYNLLSYKFSHFYYEINSQAYSFPPYLQHLLFSMLNPRIRWYPSKLKGAVDINGVIEEEILQCDRSAHIGPSSEVGIYYDYLSRNYPTKKWYRGEKTVFEMPAGFTFQVGKESKMVFYFKLFLQSGIYIRVSNQVKQNATLLKEREAKKRNKDQVMDQFQYVTAIRLEDNVQTIFILLVICLGLCVCIAVVEYVKYNRAIIASRVGLFWIKLRQLIKFRRCKRSIRRTISQLLKKLS